MHPKLRANEIAVAPVVCINPNGMSFNPYKPAVIELTKTIELSPNKEIKLIPLISNTKSSEPLKWEELEVGSGCKVFDDHILFQSTHFSLFTIIARMPFPSASVSVEEIQDSTSPLELTIPELPEFSVSVPPTSVQSHKEVVVKATAYFNDHVVSAKRDGHTLASACVELEPHGQEFSKQVTVTLPIPDYVLVAEMHPVVKLQLWHAQGRTEVDVNQSTPIKWELIADSDIVISQNDEGLYVATVCVYSFSWFQYMWDTVCYYSGITEVTRAVKSIRGRCQAFMSHETSFRSSITFSIAILIYPFRDPYPSLANYDYLLMDSGDRALNLTLDSSGMIDLRIELLPCLSYMFPASFQGKNLFSGSIALSQDCINRKDFVIKVDSITELKESMPLGQLILAQRDNSNFCEHPLSLIKVSLIILYKAAINLTCHY